MKNHVLIELFDFYGKEIPLQIFSTPKKKSLFGAIMGILSLISIGAITIYFLITLFSRDTKQIITNKNTSLIPMNDLSTMPILLSLTDTRGVPVPLDAGIYEVYADIVYSKWSKGNLMGVDYNNLPLRPCKREDIGNFPAPISDLTLSWNWCVPLGHYNLTLSSNWGDYNNGYSTINFYITKCNPKKTFKCQNETVIDNTFEQGYFSVITGASIVDNDDNSFPSKLVPQSNLVYTSTSLFKSMIVSYSQNLYTDDNGFVFENLVTHNFFTVESPVTSYSLGGTSKLNAVFGSDVIAIVSFTNSPFVITTKRTFLKAQAILANIGGVIKFIMVIAQVVTQFVVRKSAFVQIGNEVFDYRERKEINLKEKSENRILKVEGQGENLVSIIPMTKKGEKILSSSNENRRIQIINFE